MAHPIILILIGAFIRYHIGRRRFNRRSITGLQLFPNYLTGVLILTIEALFNIVGTGMIIAGLIALIVR